MGWIIGFGIAVVVSLIWLAWALVRGARTHIEDWEASENPRWDWAREGKPRISYLQPVTITDDGRYRDWMAEANPGAAGAGKRGPVVWTGQQSEKAAGGVPKARLGPVQKAIVKVIAQWGVTGASPKVIRGALRADWSEPQIRRALAALSGRKLARYDIDSGCWFLVD